MALQFAKYDIQLVALGEGRAQQKNLPGELDLCENAAFDKGGRIDKRPGYRLLDAQTAADGTAIDPFNVFHGAGCYFGELHVIGHDTLWTAVDNEDGVGGASLVNRGPVFRGNGELQVIATASLSDTEP